MKTGEVELRHNTEPKERDLKDEDIKDYDSLEADLDRTSQGHVLKVNKRDSARKNRVISKNSNRPTDLQYDSSTPSEVIYRNISNLSLSQREFLKGHFISNYTKSYTLKGVF